jgi:hypothetical protein
MKNCYFCHRPVAGSAFQIVPGRVPPEGATIRFQQSQTEALQYCHADCLKEAYRWFMEPDPSDPFLIPKPKGTTGVQS